MVVVVVGLKLPEGPSLLGWIVMMAGAKLLTEPVRARHQEQS